MILAPVPRDEAIRLRLIGELGMLDASPEPVFDDIAHEAAQVADCPIALISLVDAERQWFVSVLGLEMRETERRLAFCAHSILRGVPTVVPDTLLDARFSSNPMVTGSPGLRFYAGFPIAVAGVRIGSLCVLDRRPRALAPAQQDTLAALADAASALLDARRRRAPVVRPDTADARTALYVDDHALNRLVMEGVFSDLPQWALVLAQDAQTCVDRIVASKPDLLLLDIHLDGLHGADLLQRVRGIPGCATIPAVAVSADGQPEDIEAARRAGFDDYWVKPLDPTRIRHTLAALFPRPVDR